MHLQLTRCGLGCVRVPRRLFPGCWGSHERQSHLNLSLAGLSKRNQDLKLRCKFLKRVIAANLRRKYVFTITFCVNNKHVFVYYFNRQIVTCFIIARLPYILFCMLLARRFGRLKLDMICSKKSPYYKVQLSWLLLFVLEL